MDSYFDVLLVYKARIINTCILAVVLTSLKQQTPELQSITPLLYIRNPWDPCLKALRENSGKYVAGPGIEPGTSGS